MLSQQWRPEKAVGKAVYALTFLVYKIILGMQISGDLDSKLAGRMFVANHQSFSDPPVLGAAIITRTRKNNICFIAKTELHTFKPFAWLLGALNTIPIDRKGMDIKAVKQGIYRLQNGYGLAIFPEGTRNKTEEMLYGRGGAGYMAMKSNAEVVPVYIKNTRVPAWKQLLRLENIKVMFGKPIMLPALPANSNNSKKAAAIMMKEIKELRKNA